MRRSVLILTFVAVLAVPADAPAGGISDEQCPNVAGENTNTCPAGTVGVPYSLRFTEREGSGCGPGRQTFHHDSGTLPPGLNLSPAGTLSGTTFGVGTFRFYVEMREPTDDPAHCAGKRTQKQFTLKIRRQPWIVSSPAAAPWSEVGVPLRMALRARGGTGIFAWSLGAGRLPPGLRVFPEGLVAGTPRASGIYRVTARATDTEGRTLTWSTELRVAAKLRVRGLRLPPAQTGRGYRVALTSVGGVAPTSWRLTRGRLPHGIRLQPARGRLTGTPAEAGTFVVTFEVRDRLDVTHKKTLRIVVGRSTSRVR
jgi:hypothetical protein